MYVTGTLGLSESIFSLIIIAVSIVSKKLGKTQAAVLAMVYLTILWLLCSVAVRNLCFILLDWSIYIRVFPSINRYPCSSILNSS